MSLMPENFVTESDVLSFVNGLFDKESSEILLEGSVPPVSGPVERSEVTLVTKKEINDFITSLFE